MVTQTAILKSKGTLLEVKRGGLTRNINEMKRSLEILAGLLANKAIRVVFRGADAYTDGKTIVLPELRLLEKKHMTDEEIEAAQSFLEAIRGYLFHEVAHVMFTDFKSVKSFATSGIAKTVHNAVEDVRIEREIGKVWKGAATSLVNMNEWVIAKIHPRFHEQPLLGQVLIGMTFTAKVGRKHWFWDTVIPEPAKKIIERLWDEVLAIRKTESTEDCARLAKRIMDKLKDLIEEEKKAEKARQKGQKSDDGEEGEERVGGGGLSSDEPEEGSDSGDSDEEDDEEGDESGSGGSDDEGEDEEGEEKPKSKKRIGKKLAEDLEEALEHGEEELSRAMKQNSAGSLLKKEINPNDVNTERYLIYSTERDTVETAPEGEPFELQKLVNDSHEHFGVLRNQLANLLKAQSNSLTVSDLEEGELDSSLLYRLVTQKSDRVFKETYENVDLKNVVITLLINQSGSMVHEPERIRLAAQSAVLFGEVLDALKIKFSVMGHTTLADGEQRWCSVTDVDRNTYTRFGSNRFTVFKDFDEHYQKVKCRFARIADPTFDYGNTHDAEALLYSGKRLLEQKGATRRIIITIDDGEPVPNVPLPSSPGYGFGYRFPSNSKMGRVEMDRRLIGIVQQHNDYVIEVVKELESRKVEILGLGMCTDSVRKFYPNHVVIRSVAEFPTVFLRELKRLLLPGRK